VVFTLNTIEVRPGWGGLAIGPANASPSQFVFLTSNPLHTTNPDNSDVQPPFDERIMPALPVLATAFTWSTEATVTIRLAAGTSAVPEARQWLLLVVALLAVLAAKKCRRHYATFP
jgi:hypothetical protein